MNVWLALASERHVHAPVCGRWFSSIESGEVFFCRVTQMGLLRLLTLETVMGGDVLSQREAWRAYQAILADERIQFAPEPHGVELEWRNIASLDRPAPKLWTDAYLVAFARSAGMRLVTLDRAMDATAAEVLVLS